MLRKHNMLMNQAGDGNGGGGGGSGGAGSGTNPAGGSGASLTTPAANPPVGTDPGGTTPNGQGGGTPPPQVTIPDNWKQALPAELQSDPNLSVIKDVPGLVKSYINAQKLIGADKVPVPSKHATDDDWRNVFHKLGLPEKLEDYKQTVQLGKDSGLDESFVGQFVEQAHKFGVMPKQAKAVLDWFVEANKGAVTQAKKVQNDNLAQEGELLKNAWGDKYAQNVQGAGILFGKFAEKEDVDWFNRTGLATHPRLIKMFGKMAENFLKEGEIPGGNGAGGSIYTPQQALEEMNKIYADHAHPYWQKEHPNHQAAVNEMTRLSGMAVKRS